MKSPKTEYTCDHGKWINYGSSHENVDGCVFCQQLDDSSYVLGNPGGFLEALSTMPIKAGQREQLAKLQEVDQKKFQRISKDLVAGKFHKGINLISPKCF